VLAADRNAHRLADHLVRVDLVILDELGYLPRPDAESPRRQH
jgi:DNA replication protein DnaC